MLLFTGALGWLLARGSLRPVTAIARTARRISGANLRESVPTTGSGDELDELAHTLNEMIERIREGVERMHRFNSNAAHEMRTPLNAICSQIEVTLEKARSRDEYCKVLEEVLARARQLAEAVNAMLRLSRSEAGLAPGHVAPVAIAPLLGTLLEFFAPVAADRGIALEAGRFAEANVEGDAVWLRQLFSNLVDNAIKYCRAGDRIFLEARRRGEWLEVEVADDGPGIPTDRLGDIFDRFERGVAHPGQPGFGLGLPLAREIARAHGGRIDLESRPGHGTRFTVRLPVSDTGRRAGARNS
jgi:signal transduction histidine kinase